MSFFLVCTGLLATGCGNRESSVGLKFLLPSPEERSFWKLDDNCETVAGEDLYLVIDGGAEIVLEYGFRRALFQSYGMDGLSINLEIYEMDDSESAFGLFSIRRGKGEVAAIGQESLFEDYYLQFWKGRYFVVLIGLNSDTLTTQGIFTLARAVESRILDTGPRPDLIGLLPEEGLDLMNIQVVEGPLGLGYIEPFESASRIPVREGVYGRYADHSLLILRYANAEFCGEAFTGYQKLAAEGLLGKAYPIVDSTFHATSKSGLPLIFKRYGKVLSVEIGASSD